MPLASTQTKAKLHSLNLKMHPAKNDSALPKSIEGNTETGNV
jgi:hypothetical protein